jgi:hypothetical protein
MVELLIPMGIQGGRGSPHTPWQVLARVQCDSRWMHTETPASDVMFPGQLYHVMELLK